MQRRLAAMVALALAACSDPTIEIDLTYADPALAQHTRSLTVSVIDAVAAGAAIEPGAAIPLADGAAGCEHVAFGLVPAEVLEGARRASVAADVSPRISGVPRVGAKLVIAEAKDEDGRRIGAGCEPLGTIDADVEVAIVLELAPRVQALGRMAGETAPSSVTLIATAVWDEGVPIVDRDVLIELYGAGGSIAHGMVKTGVNGLAITPALDDLRMPGPLQTVVRVRWADEPLRVAAFNEWTRLDGLRIAPSERLPAAWITGPADVLGLQQWVALAMHGRGLVDELIAVYLDDSGLLAQRVIVAQEARALALWRREAWTVLADGWYHVTTALPSSPTVPELDAVALELHVVDRCDGGDPAGLLVRRGLATYRAYQAPGVVAPIDATMTKLAAELGNDRVVAQVCAAGPDGVIERVVVAQRGTGLRAIRISEGDVNARDFPLPLLATVTDFGTGADRGLAGAVSTQSGPRVVSFRFATYTIDGNDLDVAVATNLVDVPIATLPSSLVVADLDGDADRDTLALVPGALGPRVQVVMGREVAGQPLAAATAPILSSRGATETARLTLEQLDRGGAAADGCLELVVLTAEGADVYRPALIGAGGQTHCPRP